MKKEYVAPQIVVIKIGGQNILQQSSQQTEMTISNDIFNSTDFDDL